ncbi:hypothetical protein Dsin_016899 [Dipteronia sinensis]|uniref:DUF4218 domain-containing protein n=1 Tax=Dipteronia sinensis TaxID=43782 RepID=A0AAE0AES4_9ROSI|nr:hypothetical protein Dsin_016899 [Dipteronia sinensis]
MHIEKNVCDSVLGTLMNIDGKTKDTYKTRLDLKEMGIQRELHPICVNGQTKLPSACYSLSSTEKRGLCQFLHSMKLPDGMASNISRCVNTRDCKISGLKSHDCHIILQRLLPVALRGYLRRDIREIIIELCVFFKELTSKTLKVDVLERLNKDIVLILCKLEKIFPPSVFDIMIHLLIHLAHEAMLGCPTQYRWMYPFEREHRAELENDCVRNIEKKQEEEFHKWFTKREVEKEEGLNFDDPYQQEQTEDIINTVEDDNDDILLCRNDMHKIDVNVEDQNEFIDNFVDDDSDADDTPFNNDKYEEDYILSNYENDTEENYISSS